MKKQETSYEYEVESYAVFKNVNDTILKLNPILKDEGYEFVSFTLSELETQFSDLFTLPKEYQISKMMILESNEKISIEFFNVIIDHSLGGSDIIKEGKMFFLKRISNSYQKVVNNPETPSFYDLNEIQKYIIDLVKRLRFFKNGDLMYPLWFQINKSTRCIGAKLTNKIIKPLTRNIYTIEDEDIGLLKEHLSNKYITTDLTELAEIYFENSYELADNRARLVNLVTALESLFNRGKDQITHIISRHLSLIISNNKEEFENNYKRIKKLYGIRSKIVHGQTLKAKDNLEEPLNEIQNLVRKAILYCMNSGKSKDELFLYLNAKGFED